MLWNLPGSLHFFSVRTHAVLLPQKHLPRRQPLRKLFLFRPAQGILLTLCRAFRCLLCASSHFLAKKWKRDGKNKSICLNSKYKRSAPLLHPKAEGVRFSMSAESFQQHKTSSSHHKFPLSFFEGLSNLREWGRFLRESLCLSPDGYVIIWS